MSQPSATTHGHEAFDPRSPKTLLITACFAYPSEQGSFSGIHYYPWLSINVQQRKDASYPGLEELEAWCVASTGQLGRFAPFEPTAPSHDVEVLKWQFEDNTRCMQPSTRCNKVLTCPVFLPMLSRRPSLYCRTKLRACSQWSRTVFIIFERHKQPHIGISCIQRGS